MGLFIAFAIISIVARDMLDTFSRERRACGDIPSLRAISICVYPSLRMYSLISDPFIYTIGYLKLQYSSKNASPILEYL